jgi:HD-GYP domain-containing protein (c-di-GMP phosphodiesterase class II)
VFDALTSARPYKEAWTVGEALAEIRRQSGRQFDPALVDAFLALFPAETPAVRAEDAPVAVAAG